MFAFLQCLLNICRKFEILISQGSVATCLRCGDYCHMSFLANFRRFPTVQNFENRLRFDKVAESLKVGTFLRHSLVLHVIKQCLQAVHHACRRLT